MNSPKIIDRQAGLDRQLRHTLGHWAEQQVPPVRVRRELMRNVRQEAAAPRRHIMRQPSDGFIETVHLGPVMTFDHCFSLFYTLHARVRF